MRSGKPVAEIGGCQLKVKKSGNWTLERWEFYVGLN
jgi:hypothetical protein